MRARILISRLETKVFSANGTARSKIVLPDPIVHCFYAGMEVEQVKRYFESDAVVDHYAAALHKVGLWLSEEKVFSRVFGKNDALLELGCGSGRIAFGLYELGYRHIMATDYSKNMVKRTRRMAQVLDYRIAAQVADAQCLSFEDGGFDGAIFGFNGLMQIPGRDGRASALREIFRVLRPGAWFVFTTHDRERSKHRDFWEEESGRWSNGSQSPHLEVFGDRIEATENGWHYMHVPTVKEIELLLEFTGFRLEAHAMRSELANEPASVREFSDDCRFWVVQKPEAGSCR